MSNPNIEALPGMVNYSCTVPASSSGIGNITNAPHFVDQAAGNLRLQSNSPCINSGHNTFIRTILDLDGNPRVVGGTVDMGAYEFQSPASGISYAWLSEYRLPADGSADSQDQDGDGMNNWQEWRAGTSPIDRSSALRMWILNATGSDVTLGWASVTNRVYVVEKAVGLPSGFAFSPLAKEIRGFDGVSTFVDTNKVDSDFIFYRVGVQE
ncbi:MAG TPA: choice-of-anchor Q domain-containing protein [Clostridia bacterium]|nr:choice-of-anchor Q domain-containing protein [Clostridia bacterium]